MNILYFSGGLSVGFVVAVYFLNNFVWRAAYNAGRRFERDINEYYTDLLPAKTSKLEPEPGNCNP